MGEEGMANFSTKLKRNKNHHVDINWKKILRIFYNLHFSEFGAVSCENEFSGVQKTQK
jgi:hypothetical protein